MVMDSKRNHGVIDVFAHDAEYRKVKEYAVLLLLDDNGDIVDQYGYSKGPNVERVKELISNRESRLDS
jgi:hypothetical protein